MSTAVALNCQAAFIDFNSYNPRGYGGQFSQGSATSSLDGSTLTLAGNLWVSISYSSMIDSSTMLFLDFIATGGQGELYGIGFDNDNVNNNFDQIFLLGGTQALNGANVIDTYESGDGTVSYAIDIGSALQGLSFNRIFFILDNDANENTSVASFSNVEFCSDDSLVCRSSMSTPIDAPVGISFLLVSMFFIARSLKK